MNNANVVVFPPSTNYTPEMALQSALNHGRLTDVLVIGYDEDGDLFIRSSQISRSDGLFLLEMAKDWVKTGE